MPTAVHGTSFSAGNDACITLKFLSSWFAAEWREVPRVCRTLSTAAQLTHCTAPAPLVCVCLRGGSLKDTLACRDESEVRRRIGGWLVQLCASLCFAALPLAHSCTRNPRRVVAGNKSCSNGWNVQQLLPPTNEYCVCRGYHHFFRSCRSGDCSHHGWPTSSGDAVAEESASSGNELSGPWLSSAVSYIRRTRVVRLQSATQSYIHSSIWCAVTGLWGVDWRCHGSFGRIFSAK